MKPATLGLAACLVTGLSSIALADDLPATEQFSGTKIGFQLKDGYASVRLSVSGPKDFHASVFARSGVPTIDLRKYGKVEDGPYVYELTAATAEKMEARTKLDDGRGAGARTAYRGVATSGTFMVKDGAIVPRDAVKPSRRDQPSAR